MSSAVKKSIAEDGSSRHSFNKNYKPGLRHPDTQGLGFRVEGFGFRVQGEAHT